MDFFLKAKTIKLTSHGDKYLVADEDCATIALGRDGSSKNALWSVEFVDGKDNIRLMSSFGTYLTASGTPLLPGVTGKVVIQSWPSQFDAATEWQPLRDGMQVKMRSSWGNFLRTNGGLPPWRNSITHDVPHRTKTSGKALWDIEVVEKGRPEHRGPVSVPTDQQKQSDNINGVLLDNDQMDNQGSKNVKCFWYPKACISFTR